MAKKNLLLVDADSKSLRMLEVSLRKSGFSVTTAISAGDAREKVRHAQPDLIITDTKLPGDENGFELVANLKSAPETQGIPIIFLSSENRLEQKVTGLELGVEDYLTKPIYIREVLTRVRVLLEKREKEKLERRERSSSFSGSLGEMGLVDLLQTVEIGRKTGRLHVETQGQQGTISFREGKVTDARTGRLSGERAFYRMLVWNEGVFSMDFGPHDAADVIELSTQGLLMEGMRRVDEWGRLLEQLPPLDRVFEIDFGELVDRLAEIPDEINAILRLFDGRRNLIEVVDESDFGDLEALEIASKLFFEGLIYDVTDRPPEENEPAPQQVQKIEQWLESGTAAEDMIGGDELLANGRLDPTQPPGPALPEDVARGVPTSAVPTPSTAPPVASSVGVSHTQALPASLRSPMAAGGVMGMSEPSTAPGFLLGSVVPGAGVPSTLPAPPRPLPAPAADEPEARSVVPRTAVGATAWSSPPKGRREEAWEDVVASDVGLDEDDLGLSELQGKRDETMPPPGGAGSTPPRPAPPSARPPISVPSRAATPPSPPPAPPVDDIDLGAQIAAALPPELADAASSFDEDAAVRTPSARARPPAADTIPDRPSSAISTAPPAAVPSSTQAHSTVVNPVQAAVPAASAPPTGLPTSTGLLSMVGSGAGTAPPSLAPPVEGDVVSLPRPMPLPLPAQAQSLADAPTALAPTPPPAPLTSAPSAASSVPSSSASSAPPAAPSAAPSNVPSAASFGVSTSPPAERIHTQRTQIDIEPIPSSFGVSPFVAGGLIGIAVVVGAAIALLVSDDDEAVAVADAGVVVELPRDVPGAADAGVATARVVADAGFAQEAVVDAGSVAALPPPDAGTRAVVSEADAGVVASTADAGGVPQKTPEQEYAERLKSGETFSRRGEFAKAVREYKAALALKPGSLPAHLGLGNAYYELDTIDAALVHLEKARTIAPRDPQAYVLLGAVYQSSGRKDDAVEAYKRYLELAPSGKFSRDVRGILKGMGALAE